MKKRIILGERIKELRELNHISQVQLAHALGISKASVHQWEACISIPSPAYLVEMTKIFNVTMDYLMGLTQAESVDISHLKSEQKEIIYNLVQCFTHDNQEA